MDPFDIMPTPTAQRPLLGLTVLVVEDSLFASEALRLLCLRSGARIRRADCLRSARRHLQVYRPQVVIIDLGLPDGSGRELIAQLSNGVAEVDVILGMSGDPALEAEALSAGAHCFLEKPLVSLAAFQEAILRHLPADRHPAGPRIVTPEQVEPDRLAFQDDVAHAAEMLKDATDETVLDYLAQFLGGVAHCAGDQGLAAAAQDLRTAREKGATLHGPVSRLAGVLQDRTSQRMVI